MRLLLVSVLIILSCSKCKSGYDYGTFVQDDKVYKSLEKAIKNKEGVTVLDLSNQELNKFPYEIFELKNLKVLNLNNNNIKVIPDQVKVLKNLEVLFLMENQIKSLPSEITELKNLRNINLMKNQLSALPSQMVELNKLERLLLAYNDLSEDDVKELRKALPDSYIVVDIIL